MVGGASGERRRHLCGGRQCGRGVREGHRVGHRLSFTPWAWNSTEVGRVGTIATSSERRRSQRSRVRDRGAQPAQPQRYAVPGALGPKHAAVDEQVRVVDAGRRCPGDPLGHGDHEEPGQRGVGDRVDDQRAAGPQHPARLGEDPGEVGDVLEDLAGRHHIGHLVRQRQRPDVAAHRADAVRPRDGQRAAGQVDADVPVAAVGDVPAEKPAAAGEVHQDGAGAGRRRDQGGPGGGDPVQHRQLPMRLPPLVDQVVVLSRIVAGPCRSGDRHGASLAQRTHVRPSRSWAWDSVAERGTQSARRTCVPSRAIAASTSGSSSTTRAIGAVARSATNSSGLTNRAGR